MDAAIELIKTANALLRQRIADQENAMAKIRQGHDMMLEGYNLLSKHLGAGSANLGSETNKLLTDREKEIFTLLGQGIEPAKIAEKLNLSIKTVSVHKDKIRKKLKLSKGYEVDQLAKSQSQNR